MSTTLTTVSVMRQRVYALHGVLPQEQAVGSHFAVSASVTVPTPSPSRPLSLGDTVDYASLSAIISEEMEGTSKLIESVAVRIKDRILALSPGALSIRVSITKEAPPLSAECEGASVEINYMR